MLAANAAAGGGATGALTDLLGLESELTNIQAGIRQIDQIGSNPAANVATMAAALQNQQQQQSVGRYSSPDMIPLGSLQTSSGNFPSAANHQSSLPTNHMSIPNQQPVTMAQQQGGQQKPHYPQAIMKSGGVTSKPDLFGAAPFLPPPPSKVISESIALS